MKKIAWEFPCPRTHCGMPLGNGLFGALIWGMDRIHITVNRADFWDHRGGERQRLKEGMTYDRVKAAYDPRDTTKMEEVLDYLRREKEFQSFEGGVATTTRLPMGRFDLQLRPDFAPVRGELEIQTGRAKVVVADKSRKSEHALTFLLSPERDVLLIQDPDRVVEKVIPRPAWEWVGEHLARLRFSPPRIVAADGLDGWIQDCPADPSVAALCKQTPDGFTVTVAPGSNGEEAKAAGLEEIRRGEQQGTPFLLAESDRWWRRYWGRTPKVKLPDAFFSMFLDFAMYKFACATNPHSPLPAALQGPWIEEYQMPGWSGLYVFDINVQQAYMPAYPANQLDHLLPLFDMLENSYRDIMRRNARVFLGADDGLLMSHYCDERGETPWLTVPSLLYVCGAWIAQLHWLYYQYTGDVEFLRRRAYPFMTGIMRAVEAMLEEKDGRLSIPLAGSPEYGYGGGLGRDPSFVLAAVHMLADALLESASILGVQPKPILTAIKERLPLYTLAGSPGKERIALWEGEDMNHPHVHHSHLMALYPFDSLGAMTPEKRKIVENSIEHWITTSLGSWNEWSLPLAAAVLVRAGVSQSPMRLMEFWSKLCLNEGLATQFNPFGGLSADLMDKREATPEQDLRWNIIYHSNKEVPEIMQIDGTLCAASVVYECLVHSRSGVVHVFPAIPDDWKNVSFKSIRVPGPFLVSAARKDGTVASVKIKALRGGTIRCQVHGAREMTLAQKGKSDQRVAFPLTLELKKGEVVSLNLRLCGAGT